MTDRLTPEERRKFYKEKFNGIQFSSKVFAIIVGIPSVLSDICFVLYLYGSFADVVDRSAWFGIFFGTMLFVFLIQAERFYYSLDKAKWDGEMTREITRFLFNIFGVEIVLNVIVSVAAIFAPKVALIEYALSVIYLSDALIQIYRVTECLLSRK
jgi:hypothetical protein